MIFLFRLSAEERNNNETDKTKKPNAENVSVEECKKKSRSPSRKSSASPSSPSQSQMSERYKSPNAMIDFMIYEWGKFCR